MARETPTDVVTAELSAVGISWEVSVGKHSKIRFIIGSKRLTYVVPLTTSDKRAFKNARCGIRRFLRLHGVEQKT